MEGTASEVATAVPHDERQEKPNFPTAPVVVLTFCLVTNAYTLVNLFPYIGVMVQHLMGLPTTNEVGETQHVRRKKL